MKTPYKIKKNPSNIFGLKYIPELEENGITNDTDFFPEVANKYGFKNIEKTVSDCNIKILKDIFQESDILPALKDGASCFGDPLMGSLHRLKDGVFLTTTYNVENF